MTNQSFKWALIWGLLIGSTAYSQADYPYNENYPKDMTSHPYTGQKSDALVGVLGGTGCTRHWDVLDTEDSNHRTPFDLCGPYSMVSKVHHKWVDLRKYGNVKKKIFTYPIHGDGVLELAQCDSGVSTEVFKLIQHRKCGDEGEIIALCDRAGHDLTDALAEICR